VRPDDPDPHELAIREGSQCNSTFCEMALALSALVSDRVLALPSVNHAGALKSRDRCSSRSPCCTYRVSIRSMRSISPIRSRPAGTSRLYVISLIVDSLHIGVRNRTA
jgi:hypothetical protein